MAEPVHVLIVNHSAVARVALEDALAGVPDMRVTLAGDGAVAQARIQLDPPDVMLLALELPRMPGLELLGWVMATRPIPVVIYSPEGPADEQVIRALGAGAVAVIDRPRDGRFSKDVVRRIADRLRAAHHDRDQLVQRGTTTRPPAPRAPIATLPAPAPVPPTTASRRTTASSIIVAIGASTGGTEALASLLPRLPVGFPGTVVVQHMPAVFTRNFAERLDRLGGIRVREAADGDVVEDGVVLIAPGDRHTRIVRGAGGFAIEVFDDMGASRYRPSVDVLFHSVATAAGPDALGVIMTGMGADGAAGLAAMHAAGARTIGQDEASSTVYGMPRVAAELGAVDIVASLDALPAQMIAVARSLRRGAS
jgi:two-component system chemotaxis response regulator CheB